ncbi:MAG: rod shape-determining protein RodA [Betaproteobacteria bacterium]
MNLISQIAALLVRRIDGFLLGTALAISGLGLLVLYSATDASTARVSGQALNLLFALGVMWVAANITPQHYMRWAVPLFAVGVLLLVGVALFGTVVNGSRRWLSLGVTRIQPSEMMKIAVPLLLAWHFNRQGSSLRLRDFAIAALLILVPVALIARQPDLGTALLIAGSGFFVLYLAGLNWKIIVLLVLIGGALVPVVWPHMHDYQQERVLVFLDPSRDPLGRGYHIIQGTIALGSGGVLGKGWMNGTQTHLDFLPERHTDFIFAVYGEEFGLLGGIILLALYLLLIARGFVITAGASTLFTRLLAGAITLMFFTYAFVNMGMVSGILPVVGIPLPLMSYGGTALVTLFLGIGMLMSVHANRKLVKT